MKLSLILGLFLLSTIQLSAQEWFTNFDVAQQEAKTKELPIVLVFQGSDWCAPCIKLDKEIWSTEEFKKYAKDHYVMLKADFPRKKANRLSKEDQDQNNKLAEKYNPTGYFPHVVMLNSEGKVLGRSGYEKKSPKEYIALINSFL